MIFILLGILIGSAIQKNRTGAIIGGAVGLAIYLAIMTGWLRFFFHG